MSEIPSASPQTIVLGGGCFWCTEAVFDRVEGVLDVESGYANGHVDHPTYEQVCSGTTGTAEVIKVQFDPAVIDLREILHIFFVVHDPTTPDRQGNDVGPQYRSAIYTTDDAQMATVREVVAELASHQAYGGVPIVTEIAPLQRYWPAEAYHQEYFVNHPNQGYCAFVVAPKVEKFRKTFADRVRKD